MSLPAKRTLLEQRQKSAQQASNPRRDAFDGDIYLLDSWDATIGFREETSLNCAAGCFSVDERTHTITLVATSQRHAYTVVFGYILVEKQSPVLVDIGNWT